MKHHFILKTALLIAAACLFSATSAFAGPGPQPMYVPVKAKEAGKIKPGTRLAFTCPQCHAVLGFTADAEKSYEKSVACASCKKTFVRKEVGGRGTTIGTWVYADANGHECTLLRAM